MYYCVLHWETDTGELDEVKQDRRTYEDDRFTRLKVRCRKRHAVRQSKQAVSNGRANRSVPLWILLQTNKKD